MTRRRPKGQPTGGQFAPDEQTSDDLAPLTTASVEDVVQQFGVSTAQVERDQLISHVLGALSDLPDDQLVFFGGTALSRTHLPDLRLSEDIDLIATGRRSDAAAMIRGAIDRALARPYGQTHWLPDLTTTKGSQPSTLEVADLRVQIQLLDGSGYPNWPTEKRPLHQRYRGMSPASLRVPTAPAFAASKLSAWGDRGAPRDLYDLWALTERGVIDSEAVDLYVRYGPTGRQPAPYLFAAAPSPAAWEASLGHQCRVQVGPDTALAAVRQAWLSSC